MVGYAGIGLLPSVLTVALVVTACGTFHTSDPPSDAGGPTSDDLTEEDLTDYSTVMEAVQALRPAWLRERTPLFLSPRSGTKPANPVWVYWDGTRLGDPSYLTRIATSQVSRVMYYNARVASFRWGISHENGVIYLVPSFEPGWDGIRDEVEFPTQVPATSRGSSSTGLARPGMGLLRNQFASADPSRSSKR